MIDKNIKIFNTFFYSEYVLKKQDLNKLLKFFKNKVS